MGNPFTSGPPSFYRPRRRVPYDVGPFPHLPSYLYSLHTCARIAQRRFAHLSWVSARGRKSSRLRIKHCLFVYRIKESLGLSLLLEWS